VSVLREWWRALTRRHRAPAPYDWEMECPELRLPPEGHVRKLNEEPQQGEQGQ